MSILLFRKNATQRAIALLNNTWAGGAPGGWWSNRGADLTAGTQSPVTAYQESTGITPASAIGNQVGLWLDRRLGLVARIYQDWAVLPANWNFLGASYNTGTQYLKEDGSTGWHLSRPTNSIVGGPRGILIAEVKADTRTWVRLNLGGYLDFDISTGAFGGGANLASWGGRDLGDGWREVLLASNVASANGWAALATGDGVAIYAGDNTSGLYVRNVRQVLFREGRTATNPSLAATVSTISRASTAKYHGGLLMGDSFAVTSATDPTKTVNSTATNMVMAARGTGGRTLAQILAAFTTDVGLYDPSFAVIQGGINTINAAASDPNASMQADIASLVSACVAANILPVLTKLPPDKNYASWSAARQGWTDTYNAWIVGYAASNRIPLLDLPALLSTDRQTLAAGFDSGDGLHPNAAGYAAYGAAVVALLDTVQTGLHLSQTTLSARPLKSASPVSLTFDGVDDGLSSAAVAAGAVGNADMDCFILIKRNSTAGLVAAFRAAASANYFGSMVSGGAGAASALSGTPTFLVDGVAVPGGTETTEAQLHTAMTVGAWHVLEVHNLDLSAYVSLGEGYFAAGYPGGHNIAESVVFPAQSDANRALIRRYMGNLAGLSGL